MLALIRKLKDLSFRHAFRPSFLRRLQTLRRGLLYRSYPVASHTVLPVPVSVRTHATSDCPGGSPSPKSQQLRSSSRPIDISRPTLCLTPLSSLPSSRNEVRSALPGHACSLTTRCGGTVDLRYHVVRTSPRCLPPGLIAGRVTEAQRDQRTKFRAGSWHEASRRVHKRGRINGAHLPRRPPFSGALLTQSTAIVRMTPMQTLQMRVHTPLADRAHKR